MRLSETEQLLGSVAKEANGTPGVKQGKDRTNSPMKTRVGDAT